MIDPNYIDEIYSHLKEMGVDLDENPLELGPKRLQGKVAASRNMLTLVQRLMNDLSHKLHVVRRELRSFKSEIELKTAHLMSTDPEVKTCKSVKDREAMAQMKLNSLYISKIKKENDEFELDSVLTSVKSKEKDLKDTLARLRDQIKLCQDEISLGDSWGANLAPKSEKKRNDDVSDFFNDIENEKKLGVKTEDENSDCVPFVDDDDDDFDTRLSKINISVLETGIRPASVDNEVR